MTHHKESTHDAILFFPFIRRCACFGGSRRLNTAASSPELRNALWQHAQEPQHGSRSETGGAQGKAS